MGYLYSYAKTTEPLTVPEIKAHLRIDFSDDDEYLGALISAVRWKFERTYRRAIVQQTLILGLDFFGMPSRTRDIMYPVTFWPSMGYQFPINSIIELRPPVQSITSVKYYDPSGALQTLATNVYQLDLSQEPNRIFPVLGKVWPSIASIPGAVQITFIAGPTDISLIPEDQKLAMKLCVGDFYENREDTVIGTRLVALQLPDGVQKLMAPYKFPLVR